MAINQFYIFIVAVAILFVSCSKPDDQPPEYEPFYPHPEMTEDNMDDFWSKQYHGGVIDTDVGCDTISGY